MKKELLKRLLFGAPIGIAQRNDRGVVRARLGRRSLPGLPPRGQSLPVRAAPGAAQTWFAR